MVEFAVRGVLLALLVRPSRLHNPWQTLRSPNVVPLSCGGVVKGYPAGLIAPSDDQPTFVGLFEFSPLLPEVSEQQGFVFGQRVS